MASASNVLRTFSLLLYLTLHVHALPTKTTSLFLDSLEVGSVTCDENSCKYLLNVSGVDFLGSYPWRLTPEKGAKGGSCDIIYTNYEIKEIETFKLFSKLEVSVPKGDGRIYFCIQGKSKNNAPFGGDWVHQGVDHFLELKNDVSAQQKQQITLDSNPNPSQGQEADAQTKQSLEDYENNVQEANVKWKDLTHDTDVNYLPSVQRPTRDDRNNVEVMFHGNDRNETENVTPVEENQFEKGLDALFSLIKHKTSVVNNGKMAEMKEMLDKFNDLPTYENLQKLAAEYFPNDESLHKLMAAPSQRSKSSDVYMGKIDPIMLILKTSEIDSPKPEIKVMIEQVMNAIPNYNPTFQKLAEKCFPNYGCVQLVIAIPHSKLKSRLEVSPQEIRWLITDEQQEADNMISMEDVKGAFGKELDELLAVLQSSESDIKTAEVQNLIDHINARPNATIFRKLVKKCIPDHGCIIIKMIALRQISNSSHKKSLQEILQDRSNNQNKAENLTPINYVKFDETKDREKEFDKGLHALTSLIIQSTVFNTKMAEMKEMMERFNDLPTYKTLREIAVKYFPNDESLQKQMVGPRQGSKSSPDIYFGVMDPIMLILKTNKNDVLKPEIKIMIEEEISTIPNYDPSFQKLESKCFPNYGCIQLVIAIPHPKFKSLLEISSQEIKWFIANEKYEAENVISMEDVKGTFGKKFDGLITILQSSENETTVAEIRNVIDQINARPYASTLHKILRKCTPDHGCIKIKMTALRQIAKPSLKKSDTQTLEGHENNMQEDNVKWKDLVHDIDDKYFQKQIATSFQAHSKMKNTKNDKNYIENLTLKNNAKFGDRKDKDIEFDKGFNALASLIVESTVFNTKMAEMKRMMEKFNDLPTYKTLREIAAKYFPNDKHLQAVMAEPGSNSPENLFEKLHTFVFMVQSAKNRTVKADMELLKETNDPEMTESHTNSDSSVNLHPDGIPQELVPKIRKRRQIMPDDFSSVRSAISQIVIEGIRIEDSDKEPKIVEDGIPSVLAESGVTLRVFGEGLTPNTVIAFTHDPQPYGQPCKFLLKGEYMVKEGSLKFKTALFDIRTPAPITASHLYICAKNLQPGVADPTVDEEKYIHQGTDTWKMLASHNKLLPLWVTILLILFCLMFSALFSGLNLGLMSLDRTELKIIANTGTEQERKYARAIMPVRDHGNYLLCSILLGNVAVNSTFTILLDELTSGLFAVIFSTLAIVLLGEITPQAICSRHGLMVGAKSIMVTKGVMAVTAPLSFPVSKLLDYFLGEEIGNVYNRERLKELVKVTTDVNDLDKEEVNIISGALEMRKKTVSDVMTKLEDAFMLPITSVLDFETMSEIVKSGYSRIPVYEGHRGNIVTVLFIKDLAFVDPDDNTPLRTLCQYYQNAAHFVFEDVTLDIMFKQFKDGHKGHMAFVHRINNEGEGDPFYETIGLVTLEDVIEEMIQSEIVDETDVFLDNRSKRRRRPQNKLQDFAAFAERHENQRIHISPQLTLATFQFLSTSVDAFRPDTVSETVLKRLLRQDVIQYIKIKGKTKKDPSTYVFQQGKPVDYFVLILEGRVEVTVGRENLVFEAGPFTYFGVQALTQNVGVAESPTPSAMGSLQNINMDAMLRHTFVPDYSVRAITSLYYLTVKRSLYMAAKRATLMEKGNISKGGTAQEFDTEVDKLLQSVDEDLSITGEHKTPSRQVSPHPAPASPAPRALDSRNGHAYLPSSTDEQERLLK